MPKVVDEDLIRKLVDLSHEKSDLPDVVYHYTSDENIPYIFKEDALSFKLTKASKFEDQLEGKCCDVFYDVALEELVEEKTISENDRELLEKIQPANTTFMYRRKSDGMNYIASRWASTYIGCFSSKFADPYMIEEYIKNDKHKGVCIALRSRELLEWKKEINYYGYTLTAKPVLYGREVVENLKDYIKRLITITEGTETEAFRQFGIGILKNKLANIKYMAKTGKYRKEKEYRIIIQVPTYKLKKYIGFEFDKVENGILFKIKKCGLNDVKFINMDNHSLEAAKNVLAANDYNNY